jgi:glycosyltransferase involved in cell wall biosynthesis
MISLRVDNAIILDEVITVLVFNRLVTVISHTHGRFEPIERMYNSVQEWYPDTRLLVSDDSGTKSVSDGMANSKFAQVVQLNYDVGLSTARNSLVAAAQTEYVTFADSDVWWEKNHLSSMLNCINGGPWAYCKRKIWANENDYIGIDNFESVGDEATKKVPYEMVDNNCMIFSRRLGASGAVLYRETKDYNDDRLFYKFLKQYGGVPNKTNEATINQVCPKKLEKMFRENCEN